MCGNVCVGLLWMSVSVFVSVRLAPFMLCVSSGSFIVFLQFFRDFVLVVFIFIIFS